MTSSVARAARTGLVLRPMRPVTYRTGPGRSLEAVTMRPVEVWDDAAARRLAATRSDHVLHVVAPDPEPVVPGGDAAPGPGTGRTLGRWLGEHVVARSERAALHVWSWEVAGRQVRGVVGAVDLPTTGQLLPHEQVRADVVATRAAQLGAAAVQAEPVVVLHDGAPLGLHRTEPGGSGATVELALRGERHRIWPVVDPAGTADIARVLATAPAPVVADGHHRLAALDGLAAAVPPAMRQALVLVVDVGASDLDVGTINRVVRRLPMETVRRTPRARVRDLSPAGVPHFLSGGGPGRLRWVVADADELVGLELDVDAVHALRPGGRTPCAPIARAICHLHTHLLPAWGVVDTDVDYVHDWDSARGSVGRASGVAIRTAAPSLSAILDAARAGQLLPPKATSIGPKPRIGLLMLDGRPT